MTKIKDPTQTGKFGASMNKAGNFAMDNSSAIGSAATGLLELGTNIFGGSGVARDDRGNQMQTDIYGRPIFSYQNYESSIDLIKDDAKGEVRDSVLSGTMSGLKAGSSIGSMIAPGIGTAIGAGVGALGGAIGGFIGGKKRSRQMKDEIANRERLMAKSVDQFNSSNRDFFQSSMASDVSSYLQNNRSRRVAA